MNLAAATGLPRTSIPATHPQPATGPRHEQEQRDR